MGGLRVLLLGGSDACEGNEQAQKATFSPDSCSRDAIAGSQPGQSLGLDLCQADCCKLRHMCFRQASDFISNATDHSLKCQKPC